MDLDVIPVSLRCDDTTLLEGETGEVLAGQRHALAWLINQVLLRGYSIEAGQIFMTGSIGGMYPAKPGDYRADFAQLGTLTFSIGMG